MGIFNSTFSEVQKCNLTQEQLLSTGLNFEDECRICANFSVRCNVGCHRKEAAGRIYIYIFVYFH